MRGLIPLILLALSLPSWGETPGTLHFREAGRHLWAGEQVTRTLVIDLPSQGTEATLRWRSLVGSVVLQDSTVSLHPTPENQMLATMRIQAPSAERRVQMDLVAEYHPSTGKVVRIQTSFQVYPREKSCTAKALEGKRIGVFDPSGRMRTILIALGLQPDSLPLPGSVEGYEGDLVILGPGALAPANTGKALQKLLSDSTFRIPVLVLGQESGGASLGVCNSTILAHGHPVFQGLEETDLQGWREDGVIAASPLICPGRGSYCPLLGMTEKDPGSVADALLIERIPDQFSRVVFCQLALTEKWESEPVCSQLLLNLLSYLLEPSTLELLPGLSFYVSHNSVKGKELIRGLLNLGGEWEPLETQPIYKDPDAHIAVMFPMDGCLTSVLDENPQLMTELLGWVEKGGKIWVAGVNAETLPLLAPLTGTALTLTQAGGEVSFPKLDDPLLWGTRKEDWMAMVQQEGNCLAIDEHNPEGWKMLVEPGLLSIREIKKGKLVIMSTGPDQSSGPESQCLTRQLFNNLGTRLPTEEGSTCLPLVSQRVVNGTTP